MQLGCGPPTEEDHMAILPYPPPDDTGQRHVPDARPKPAAELVGAWQRSVRAAQRVVDDRRACRDYEAAQAYDAGKLSVKSLQQVMQDEESGVPMSPTGVMKAIERGRRFREPPLPF
jgi:hypothetical protein